VKCRASTHGAANLIVSQLTKISGVSTSILERSSLSRRLKSIREARTLWITTCGLEICYDGARVNAMQ
jgi:hypothetical protein